MKKIDELKENSEQNYSYSFEDTSFLAPLIDNILAPFALKRIPLSVTPNTITLTSGLFAVSAFIIMLQSLKGKYHFWWAIPILLFLYLLFDALDGKQARRTGLCSPVGEFLDHFFDSAIPLYLTGGFMIVYHVYSPVNIICFIFGCYLAQISAFYEKYRTKKMYFGKFSSNETITAMTIVITLGGIQKVREVAFTVLFTVLGHPVTIAEGFLWVAFLGTIASSLLALIRAKGICPKFGAFIVSSIATAIFITFSDFSIQTKIIVISLYNISYNLKILTAITMKHKIGKPDMVFPFLALANMLISDHPYIRLCLLLIYLGFSIAFKVFNLLFTYIYGYLQNVDTDHLFIRTVSSNLNNVMNSKTNNNNKQADSQNLEE